MKSLLLLLALLCGCLLAAPGRSMGQARGPGGPPPGSRGGPGGPGGPGGMGGGPTGPIGGPGGALGGGPSANANTPGTASAARGGIQFGPPGRWWDDKTAARTIGLRRDQQQKMDTIFNANKSAIVDSYKALESEKAKLQTLTKAAAPDQARVFAEIDAVSQARAALEKATTQMLLQIRQQMDADQIVRLQQLP